MKINEGSIVLSPFFISILVLLVDFKSYAKPRLICRFNSSSSTTTAF